ncbi:peptidase C14 [Coprinopsis cinerea okayama7|uniref:Peptidase C14 n=1 Tax=Coprinopsis cinerea (strain Okayama-7 / 130 / ATCC MYA-4618 / FGSC 9003) TaxID=240176 RepID=A8P965_COPC7|nr:peptidase C14 [Coprinopsis cinerea okayama7\|eukprot:XP_001839707.2 peptidase C14 [Coprinopsis cinerea okayama7\
MERARKRDKFKGFFKDVFRGSPGNSKSSSPSPSVHRDSANLRIQQAFGGTTQTVDPPTTSAGDDYHGSPASVEEISGPPSGAPVASGNNAKDNDRSTWQDSTAFKSVKAIVDGLIIVSEAFPPMQAAASVLQKILENVNILKDNEDLAKELASRLDIVCQIFAGRPESLDPAVNARLQSLALTLEGKTKALEEKIAKAGRSLSLVGRFVFAKDDQEELVQVVREINLAIEVAVLDVTVDNNRQILRVVRDIGWVGEKVEEGLQGSSRMMEGIDLLVLDDKLGNVKGAAFGQDELGRPGCTPGTRVALLADLMGWAKNVHSPHLFWLNGAAGTGKSTISETFCSQLDKRQMLGASFFCSIKVDDRKDAQLIIPTLAKAMARSNAQFREALDAVLKSCDDPTKMKLEDQYQKLILEPAVSAFKGAGTTVVVVIDALDECGKKKATELLLKAIISQRPSVPLKFFVTSRPEAAIRRTFDASSVHDLVRLHDIEKNIVRADIFAFVADSLFRIDVIRDEYESVWPPLEVQKIADQAGDLFIAAATMVKYIDTDVGNPLKRFKRLANTDYQPLSSIDDLYDRVLNEAFNGLEEDEADVTHLCLMLLVAALRPLSVNDYARLLPGELTPDGVRQAFVALHSVVRMPSKGNDDGVISIYHASFVDYLTSEKQRGRLWGVDTTTAHSIVGEACIELLRSQLCFGVSGAATSYKSNDEQLVPLALPSELAYAASAWVDHVRRAGVPPLLQAAMKTLLKVKWLFWLEALGVEKRVGYAQSLWEVAEEPSVTDADLKALLKQIANFAYAYATPINLSTPHLYLSAIPFACASQSFPALPIPAFPCVPTIHPSQYHQTSQTLLTIHSQHGGVYSVAYSPDGRSVAVGCSDGVVAVFNADTGEYLLPPMQGHTSPVASVAFSPDGSCIASGCHGNTVRIWDAHSGKALFEPIQGHTKKVTSVAFSPDGSRIASGSRDNTVRIWSAHSGEALLEPMKGHTDGVRSVAFSPDGTRIASGSEDHTICIWDAYSGKLLLDPMQEHAETVTSVAFSPDGSCIAIAWGDDTIRIWDAHSGEVLFEPMQGHTERITSIAFSPDGSRIASGSRDNTIRIWDALSGEALFEPMHGHTETVSSVAFSPDGSYIVSGSYDKTIRIWDAHSRKALLPLMQWHTEGVTSVAFSPDGSGIASGSSDNTICIWDAYSGKALFEPIQGHTKKVTSVAFSPDGSRIASGSRDNTVRIWSAHSGEALLEPMKGYTDGVRSVAFSPDGTRIASGSEDHTICIWDAHSGKPLLEPIQRHKGCVTSVAFSPDGSRIVSGSFDETIRIRNAYSGKALLNPMWAHTNYVASVAFSPDGFRIVSGSYDATINIWDAHSGNLLLELMQKHAEPITSVAFSPDGTCVASGSDDSTIRIWDAHSGKGLLEPMEGHTNGVTSVAFSPNGSCIASGSHDKTVRLWTLHPSPTPSLTSTQIFAYHYPFPSLRMGDDGWIRNQSGDLLLWVLPKYRGKGPFPGLHRVIGCVPYIDIELTDAVWHGKNWKK